ncbi:hypothetical protein RFI_13516 [Reticulomyxa filosa]|uniref:Uncharacterized protein n=1 Tax=Reticulomyxa filosa TaxID=46433 RepID=X6NE85_RETFI|nr:hypothetical protein RFI_13516 [Reticulomyxa filosa]|eukprot:ETO23662.1 hypothetical protein RFI_13516 [Reticulomyxa filosa]
MLKKYFIKTEPSKKPEKEAANKMWEWSITTLVRQVLQYAEEKYAYRTHENVPVEYLQGEEECNDNEDGAQRQVPCYETGKGWYAKYSYNTELQNQLKHLHNEKTEHLWNRLSIDCSDAVKTIQVYIMQRDEREAFLHLLKDLVMRILKSRNFIQMHPMMHIPRSFATVCFIFEQQTFCTKLFFFFFFFFF